MGAALMRTAYSPNIKERRDFSCAVFDGEGRLLAQAAHIPVHLGAMPLCVAEVLGHFDSLDEGDVVMLNDPYAGGTHLPDITLVTPVRVGQRRGVFAYLATRAHHADVGGMSPGSLPLSTDIHQEGLRVPPVRLYRRGKLNEDLLDVLLANVRTPEERLGDLRAQIAAHEIGAKRLGEVVGRHGEAEAGALMRRLLSHARELMEAVIEGIPDGVYEFEDWLDGARVEGVGVGGTGPLKIRVALTIEGRRAHADFTGSAPQCATSLNAVEGRDAVGG